MLMLQKRVELACSPATAFMVFCRELPMWWPVETHSLAAGDGATPDQVMCDPRVGGKLYEVDKDGETRIWGEFKEFEPNHRMVIAWYADPNAAVPTIVEILFGVETNGTSVAVLNHVGWDQAYGEQAEAMKQQFEDAWDFIFGLNFVAACKTHAPAPEEVEVPAEVAAAPEVFTTRRAKPRLFGDRKRRVTSWMGGARLAH